MNKSIIYFLVFGTIAVILTISAIYYVDRFDNVGTNPDSYTINTSEIRTENGHVLICTYKENSQFTYVIGCSQIYGGD